MILVDANLLVYAHVADSPPHRVAREWLDARMNGAARVGLPWASLLAFLRLVTNPRIFDKPEPVAGAWAQVRAWLGCSSVWVPAPGDRHADILDRLLSLPGVSANLIPDVHLAALAIEHGLTVCSNDADFARFPAVSWVNPLVAT